MQYTEHYVEAKLTWVDWIMGLWGVTHVLIMFAWMMGSALGLGDLLAWVSNTIWRWWG